MAKQLSPAGQKIFVSVFCLIFITVGLALWIPNFLLPVLRWSARKTWKETPCTVVKSPAGKDETYEIGVVFRYEYDGLVLDSGDPGTLDFFSAGGRALWNLKPGSSAVCYVDPRPPHHAVLGRDFDPEIFIWCAPLLFVLLPGIALVVVLFRDIPKAEAEAPPDGSVVLANQRGSKGCGIAFQLGFLLTFGGIGALLVVVPGFRQSIVIRLLYLAPIGFFTLLILRSLIRSLFRPSGPGLTLTVTPGKPAPGQTIEVRWESTNISDRAKNFRLTLEGREETKVREGRVPQVQKATFETLEVAKGGSKDLKRGYAKLEIPAATMHSFVHGSRSFVWVFRLAGEVPGLDKDGDEYPFEIAVEDEEES